MTIDEAIKFKEEYQREHYYGFDPKFVEADKLGIEALKAWIEGRQKHGWFYFPLLPSETED